MTVNLTDEKIIAIVNAQLDTSITIEEKDLDLSTLGMDSISFVQIIVELEDAFQCEFPDSMLEKERLNTVSKLKKSLLELLSAR